MSGLGVAWALPAAQPAAALTVTPGKVVAWGYNASHQIEVPAEALSGVTRVAGGCNHSLALKSGKVIAWGDNTFGQTSVPAAAQSGVIAISAGCQHSLALKSNGTIVAWGENLHGELDVPTLPAGAKWLSIGAGHHFNVCIASTNDIYRWGTGPDSPATPPWQAADAEAGTGDFIVLKKDGTVSVTQDGPASLAAPAGLTGVTQVDIGREHIVVLKSDGTVRAWGENDAGQINVPAGLTGVTVVAAGGQHSLALKSNGTIVAWGRNDHGEASVPPAPAGYRYSYVVAGIWHSLAILAPGLPGAPQNPTATASDGAATISWQAPASDGGSPITKYTVTSTPDGKKCTTTGALTCSIGGLTNGTGYVFTVKATNIGGDGPASTASAMVYPQAAATAPPSGEPTAEPGSSGTSGASGAASAAPSSSPTPGGGGGGGTDPALLLMIGAAVGLGVALLAGIAFMLGRRGGSSARAVPPPPEPAPPARSKTRKGSNSRTSGDDSSTF